MFRKLYTKPFQSFRIHGEIGTTKYLFFLEEIDNNYLDLLFTSLKMIKTSDIDLFLESIGTLLKRGIERNYKIYYGNNAILLFQKRNCAFRLIYSIQSHKKNHKKTPLE